MRHALATAVSFPCRFPAAPFGGRDGGPQVSDFTDFSPRDEMRKKFFPQFSRTAGKTNRALPQPAGFAVTFGAGKPIGVAVTS